MKRLLILLFLPVYCFGQVATKIQSTTTAYSVATSLAALTNSTTETTLFSQSLPAGLLGTAKHVYVTFIGQMSSTLINPTITLKFKYGTGVLTLATGLSINASLTSSPFIIEAEIIAGNSTSSQIAFAKLLNNGSGIFAFPVYLGVGTWTIDSTTAQNISITAQFNSALTGTTLVPMAMTIETR